MNKPLRISPSSIKTFMWSKSKRCWQYILLIKDEYENDSLLIGKLFENYLFTGKDDYSILEWVKVSDMEKLIEAYDNLKYNSDWDLFLDWDKQVEIKWELFGVPYIWYIDRLTDFIEDIKTSQYLTKDDWQKNMRSGMSYRDEYRLQLYLYSKATWNRNTRIREYWKFKYKDWRKSKQIIEFVWTDEMYDDMEKKLKPVIEEMSELWNKFNF